MTADDRKADAGLKRKRETQRERVTRAIDGVWDNTPVERQLCCELFADAAIAAYPEPHIKKGRDKPKLPTDDCVLCATRKEFVALVTFIEMRPNKDDPDWLAAWGLACALREQGVVR